MNKYTKELIEQYIKLEFELQKISFMLGNHESRIEGLERKLKNGKTNKSK